MTEPGSSLTDLKDALKETLEARGSLGQIKARIRAEIFSALDDENVPKPKLSNDNLLINELIREYLAYNGYAHALSVFVAESGQPIAPAFQRDFLAHELGVNDDPRFVHVPLLYGIVASMQQPREPVPSVSKRHHTATLSPLASVQDNSTTSTGIDPSPIMYQK